MAASLSLSSPKCSFVNLYTVLHREIGRMLSIPEIIAIIKTSREARTLYTDNALWGYRLDALSIKPLMLTAGFGPDMRIHAQISQVMNFRVIPAICILRPAGARELFRALPFSGCQLPEMQRALTVNSKLDPALKTCALDLLTKKEISEDVRAQALLGANNDRILVKALLAPGTTLSYSLWKQALNRAGIDRSDLVDPICIYGARISEAHRGTAVCWAAEDGNHKLLSRCLALGEISDEDRGMALQFAAERNCHTIVAALLQNGPIPPIYMKRALEAAQQKGYVQTVSVLKSSEGSGSSCVVM